MATLANHTIQKQKALFLKKSAASGKKYTFSKTSLLLFTLLSFGLKLSAQKLSGKIADQNNHPLELATLQLFAAKDTTKPLQITLSDSLGNFELHNLTKGNYLLKASYLNFPKVELNFVLEKDTTLNIDINITEQELQNVTVSSKIPSFKIVGDRFVYTPNKLSTQASNALEIMQHVPLVLYDQKNDIFSIIGKKGTIIYLNNKKTNMPKEVISNMLKTLPAKNIKNIEILTMPGAEFDANLIGGIININIKRNVDEGWFGVVNIQTLQGYYNTTVFNGSIGYRKEKIGFQLQPFINNSYNFDTSFQNAFFASGTAQKTSFDYFRRYMVIGGGVNFDYDLNKNSFISYNGFFSSVNGKSFSNSISKNYTGANTSVIDSMQSSHSIGKDRFIYNFGNIIYQLILDSTKQNKLELNADYYQFSQSNDYNGTFNALTAQEAFIKTTAIYNNILPQTFFNLSEKLEYSHVFKKNLVFKAGTKNSHTVLKSNLVYRTYNPITTSFDINTNLTNDYGYREDYIAAFSTMRKNFGEKYNATIGFRLENTKYRTSETKDLATTDTNYLNLFPNISVGYSPNQNNQLGIGFSRKITRPNFEQLFPGRRYITESNFIANNPFLQPILYTNVEISYALKSKYIFMLGYSAAKNAYTSLTFPIFENGIRKLKTTTLNYGFVKSFDAIINLNQSFFNSLLECQFNSSLNYRIYKNVATAYMPKEIQSISYSIFFDNTIFISKVKGWTGYITFSLNSGIKTISNRIENNRSSLDIGVKKVFNAHFSILAIATDIYNGNSIIKTYQTDNPFILYNYQSENAYNRSISVRLRYIFGNRGLRKTKTREGANEDIKNRSSR